MWVPNSERVPKMPSLEGENEIPHIPKLDFLAKMQFFVIWVELIKKWGLELEDSLPLTLYISILNAPISHL